MKTLKVLLQEVVSGIKAWVNSNFAQESNTVHKTGDETVNGVKTFGSECIFTDTVKKINSNIVKGTNPSSDTLAFVNLWGGTGVSSLNNALFSQRGYVSADGSTAYYMYALENVLSGTHTSFSLKYDPNDTLNKRYAVLRGDLRPYSNNDYNLGTSSNQWNNVYAKNYYYNGTAWGLNKNNTWTGGNIFSAETYNNHVLLTNTTLDLSNGNPALSETNQGMILFTDKNKWQGNTYARLQSWTTSDQTITVLAATYRPDANTETDFSVWISNRNNDTTFHPYGVPNPNLGNSTYKWKTLNGVNPGALSLPEGSDSGSIAVDITDWYIQDPDYPDDPTKKILDATNHKVDTAVPGWLHINFPNVAGNWAYVRKYAAGTNMALQRIADGNASGDFANVALIFPIYSSCYVRIKAKTATVRIFPCLGNV